MMNEKLESVAMASENGFQESQVSASSNIRRKVDVLNGREDGNSKEQMIWDSKCNLRMSLAWDSAFFTSPGVLEPEELFTTLNSRNYDNVVNILGNEEHLLLSSQSPEPDTNSKAENYNFRKSLAWDNGFFTSEGVLNPIELAMVNNGFKKSESHLLPVIEDEVWRSMESNSTLDREGSSLTRLEMDLFEDIRASIPKPISSRFELGRPASAEQDGSRTMMKALPTCRRHSINKHGSKKIIREMSKNPKIQLKHMGESTEHYSSPSLKPSNASEQTNCLPRGSTKMASLGKKHVKLGSKSGILAPVEGLGKLKTPCLRNSYAIHGCTQSLRSSIPHCSAPTNKSVSCTASKVSRRPPSEITVGKSPTILRRKVNSKGSKTLVVGPASTTPLMKKTRETSKTEGESSCQSTPTSSWYGSPSSSIDEWPSSTSTTQRSNRWKHSPYSSLRSSRIENENQESHAGHETSENQRHRKDHKEDGNGNTSSVLREVKPSGLRMPSPKLGFFDPQNMLELATIADTKQDIVTRRTRRTKLQSPKTLPDTKIQNRKNGGKPVSVTTTKGNRSPTANSYNTIYQFRRNRSDHDDKENEISFVHRQIEGLAEQVNSTHLSELN